MKKYDVLDIGVIVADLPVKLPVDVLDFQTDTIRVPSLDFIPGGDAANSAIVLAQLGKKTALLGALGNDGTGNLVRGNIASRGVDTRYVRMKEGVVTSVSIVMVNSGGDRTFICTRGNNQTLCAQDLDFGLIGETRHINLSSLFAHPLFEKEGGPEFFESAKNAGVTISADAGHDNYHTGFSGVERLLQFIDIFMPSYTEAKYMTGETDPARMAKFIMDRTGEKTVVIKLGGQGCYVRHKGKGFTVPAFRTEVVDTAGAGDNFVAGFVSAYLDGLPVRDCARFACAAAAVSVGYLGATSPNTSLANIQKLMNSGS